MRDLILISTEHSYEIDFSGSIDFSSFTHVPLVSLTDDSNREMIESSITVLSHLLKERGDELFPLCCMATGLNMLFLVPHEGSFRCYPVADIEGNILNPSLQFILYQLL